MNVFIIILVVAVIAVAVLYFSAKNAQEIDESQEEPKFQPRKVTVIVSDTEKPKRKKKKYYNKKKKTAVANNETVEKRPVGRPRKTAE